MKAVVVYYSMTGNVGMVAKKIAEKTGADLLPLLPQKAYPDKGFKKFIWGGKSAVMGEKPKLQPYDFDADKYDTIIFGTPVWASTYAPPLRSFFEKNKEKLSGKTFAAVVCFSGGGADKALEKMKKEWKTDAWKSTLILLDPKDNPKEEDEEKIEAFCKELAT